MHLEDYGMAFTFVSKRVTLDELEFNLKNNFPSGRYVYILYHGFTQGYILRDYNLRLSVSFWNHAIPKKETGKIAELIRRINKERSQI